MKQIQLYILLFVGLAFSSCNKFLDVQPSGTLTNDQMFNNVQGFRDGMYGVYASMAKTDLYGENLSYGFADKIGQVLLATSTQLADNDIKKYNYLSSQARPYVDAIWTKQYEVISYVNNILDNLDKTTLSHSDLDLIRGEALGLRAFLHFDIVRLFAPDYRLGSSERGIPYSFAYDLNNKEVFTLEGTFKNIIADLTAAEKALSGDIEGALSGSSMSSEYSKSRHIHFNKWAVKATLARVYYTMGDYEKAALYAKEVINSGVFSLTASTAFRTVRRFDIHSELIFGLYTTALNEKMNELFHAAIGSGDAVEGRKDLETLYEVKSFSGTNMDVRYNTYYRKESVAFVFTRFLESSVEMTNSPVKGVTLIRLPEMYYILAESLYDTDKNAAIEALNTVRASRGLAPLTDAKSVSREAFETELLRERMCEMPGEGQTFFSYKHFNRDFKDFTGVGTVTAESKIFVLPWPEMENEFGSV